LLARPALGPVLRGTFMPTMHVRREFLSLIVAVMGTRLSAYLFSWQSNQEVEEEIAMGRRSLWQRRGATEHELRKSWWDVVTGMIFSNVIMYFIVLATASTLFVTGHRHIDTAAQAAQSLTPLVGSAAGLLFAAGVVAVGFLAVPVM